MATDILFQSSRPVRDATIAPIVFAPDFCVSILASRERRDNSRAQSVTCVCGFQSSRPVRDATLKHVKAAVHFVVSILASRERRDYNVLRV